MGSTFLGYYLIACPSASLLDSVRRVFAYLHASPLWQTTLPTKATHPRCITRRVSPKSAAPDAQTPKRLWRTWDTSSRTPMRSMRFFRDESCTNSGCTFQTHTRLGADGRSHEACQGSSNTVHAGIKVYMCICMYTCTS